MKSVNGFTSRVNGENKSGTSHIDASEIFTKYSKALKLIVKSSVRF